MNKEDKKYERWLSRELFKLSLLFYDKENSGNRLGANSITVSASMGHGEVRDRIRENLDFLNMTIKYNLMDLDATRRELAEKV
ncbi:hypothetical protein LCGC14_2709180 [marine sediment metagenome]|uniref:Uncharacterized protein n=1 Tax=marine sediment metagenome TaxID=412755 RepID=A0A0F9C560_9ZZZZ